MNAPFRSVSVLGLGLLCLAGTAVAEELTVVTWSGAYARSQILGFIRDYEAQTGVDVEVITYTGGIDEIREQVRSYNVKWDVVDMEYFDAVRAGREGLLESIPVELLSDSPEGVPAYEDFFEGAVFEYGVGSVVFSTVIAYNADNLQGRPRVLEDFFDLSAFPGGRGLRLTPKVNLEWALLADGVSPEEVYPMLETEEGLERAFAMLDRIKPQIVWWRKGLEAVRMLETGEVALASAYNGRIFSAAQRGEPLEIVWDGQVRWMDVWAVPRHSQNRERALDFVRFATRTESLAAQARLIPYGPMRRSSLEQVEASMRRHLPTAEANLRGAFKGDAAWWADNLDRIQPKFDRWVRQSVMVPERLPR